MSKGLSEQEQPTTAVAQSLRSLSTVNEDCGFHFYTSIGDYTGVTATSIQDLAEKMRSVSLGSVRFHFERGDFQRWIKTIFCDPKLAESIGLIKPHFSDEALRREIIDKIEARLSHLRTLAK